MPFVHLHVRSEFSLLEGVPSVKALVARAKALGYKALALTDVNRMSGLILFLEACREAGIKPILGAEIVEAPRAGAADRPGARPEGVVILARNAEGYGDLCEILTRRQLEGAAFTIAGTFAREWPNLRFLTASPRHLKALAAGPNRARLHGELVRHGPESRARSRELEALCDAEGIPAAASGDARFLEKADHEVHRILRAIDLNSTLSRLKPGEAAPEGAWLMGPERMAGIFADRPEALEEAGRAADDCDGGIDVRSPWIMPRIDVPRGYTPDTWLARLAYKGLFRRYGRRPDFAEAKGIQEMELGVIRKLGYSSYFLMIKEVRDWAGRAFRSRYRRPRDCSILRGSGANSLTFHNLGVCNLDPLGLDLYFQRFLNEDRAAPPDADLDFGWDERDKALQFMADRFGRDRVAITCTTNCFRGRAAFRETAKVFGYSEEQVTAVLDSFETRGRRIDDAEVRRISAWARRIHGKPRFIGQHPGGLIVTNGPIRRHVACEWSRGRGTGPGDDGFDPGRAAGRPGATDAHEDLGRIVTQVDMHNGIDQLGLIKFDLLGNGSLSVLRDALDQLEEQGEPDPEVWDLRKCFDDPAVGRMLAEGRTRGIFYIESPAQIRLNQRAMATSFEEVVVTSSLIRPAGTAYCKTYVERHRKMKTDVQDWTFLHPALEPILGDTHDVCAFQEDVIRICHDVAGLSFKESDRIRKMMNSQHEGRPDPELWERTRAAFIDGCRRNPHPQPFTEAQAAELWTRVASFSGFSFCKSHSASYAELSFQCGRLKAHYPAQFLSAVISNRHGFYTRGVYLDEARRCGVRVLPLSVNHSRLQYRGHGKTMRPGLLPVRDCREAAMRVLVDERDANGPYRDLVDLLQRVPLHRREAENLILAGACGEWGLTQPQLLYQLDAAYPHVHRDQGDLLIGAAGSAAEAAVAEAASRVPYLAEYPLMQRCLNELRMLGYVLSANMLDVVRMHPAARDAVPSGRLGGHVGRRVKVLGMPVTDRIHPTARDGRFMKFLTLGDGEGYLDVILWPDALERWNDTLQGQVPFSGNLVEVRGKVSEDWGTFSLEADHVRVIEWLPNQVDFALASRRLQEGLRNYPAYGGEDAGSLAA